MSRLLILFNFLKIRMFSKTFCDNGCVLFALSWMVATEHLNCD
jgi:hypothetical protein